MTSQQLKEAREKLFPGRGGITKMAEAFNTPRGTYLKWERGERRVPGIIVPALESVMQKSNHGR